MANFEAQIPILGNGTCLAISGTGKRYKFDLKLFNKAVDYCCNKFNLSVEDAKAQILYYLYCHGVYGLNTNKHYNDLALKNIVELEYEWDELFIRN